MVTVSIHFEYNNNCSCVLGVSCTIDKIYTRLVGLGGLLSTIFTFDVVCKEFNNVVIDFNFYHTTVFSP